MQGVAAVTTYHSGVGEQNIYLRLRSDHYSKIRITNRFFRGQVPEPNTMLTNRDVRSENITERAMPIDLALARSTVVVKEFGASAKLKQNCEKDPRSPCMVALSGKSEVDQVYPAHKGFTGMLVNAYNLHHDLVLRPDDVWQAILSQFSLYSIVHFVATKDIFLVSIP